MKKYLYSISFTSLQNLILGLLIIYILFNILNKRNLIEGYRDAKVFIGSNPHSYNNLLFENTNFGSHSIYEFGLIENPFENKIINKNNVYNSSFGNVYGDYYQGYYN